MSFLDGLLSGAVGAIGSLIGGSQRNEAQREQAESANVFSAQQFATRYQTTVQDMAAAGLNPMLAYSQGAGGQPSGQQAQIDDVITPAVQQFNQNRLASAQVANIEADTENKKAQADLIAGQASHAWSSAGQARANTELINRTAEKITEEIKNVPDEGHRLRMMARMLVEQGNLLQMEQMTESERVKVQRATAAKVAAEAGIQKLDLDVMQRLDNIGKVSRELQPAIEIIKSLFLRR